MNHTHLAIFLAVGVTIVGVSHSTVSAQGAPNNIGNMRMPRQGDSFEGNDTKNSSSVNAIKVNPLFQLFDTDGNGELSLAEIDAASRLLYRLDANEDDRITADEVGDLAGGSSGEPNAPENPRFSKGGQDDRSAGSMRPPAGRSGGPRISSMGGANVGGGRARTSGNSGRGSAQMSPPSRGSGRGDRGGRGGPQLGSMRGVSNSAGDGQDGGPKFEDYDKNGDGVIKRTEISSSRLRAKYKTMDANDDKGVDRAEFDKYMSDPALNGGVK